MNGGCLASGAEPSTSAVYTCTNSNWDGTSVFTPTDGSTPASTVTVGDFASVYLDAATVAVYIARVTVVAAGANGAITLSTSAKSGSAPSSGATGRTIKVGGAWKGPNAAENFPFGFITNAAVSASNIYPRVNLKNDADYNITAAITHANAMIQFEGYTSTFGDGGRAAIDGGATGTSYVLLTNSATGGVTKNLILKNNGDTGTSIGFLSTGTRQLVIRCVVHDVRGSGFDIRGSTGIECEAYNCNQSNTSGAGGFSLPSSAASLKRCIAHDNTGSTNSGISVGTLASLDDCICESNGQYGITVSGNIAVSIFGCDVYSNGGSGLNLANNGAAYVENCNFVKNSAYGIIGNTFLQGMIVNCAFGTGTMANSSGTTNTLGVAAESGSVSYASGVTPWVDPANGDFRINLATAKNVGRGTFTQTAPSYAGTVSYPDCGATQHLPAFPAVTDVRSGTTYDGGTYTGTMTEPAAGDVQQGVQYGAAGTEFTGTFAYPAITDVTSGVGYGAGGTEFTGTKTGGGGGGPISPIGKT